MTITDSGVARLWRKLTTRRLLHSSRRAGPTAWANADVAGTAARDCSVAITMTLHFPVDATELGRARARLFWQTPCGRCHTASRDRWVSAAACCSQLRPSKSRMRIALTVPGSRQRALTLMPSGLERGT